MQILNLSVETRSTTGTGPARRARAAGSVPGVIYGGGQDAVSVAFDAHRFQLDILGKAGEHAIVQVDVKDNPALSGPALLKAVQHHPVSGRVVHTDFFRIQLDKPVVTAVAVHFTGRAKGVIAGGVADIQLHEIEVECLPLDVPSHIDVDITELGLGASLHVSDVTLPENVKLVTEGERSLIAIHVPRGLVEAEAAAAEPAIVGADAKAAKAADKKK